jgi:hypothetical protein
MNPNLPLIGSIASIEVIDIIPTNKFEILKLVIQGVIALIGLFHNRKLLKEKLKTTISKN